MKKNETVTPLEYDQKIFNGIKKRIICLFLKNIPTLKIAMGNSLQVSCRSARFKSLVMNLLFFARSHFFPNHLIHFFHHLLVYLYPHLNYYYHNSRL